MKRLFLTYLLLITLTTICAQEKEEKLVLSGYIKNLHEFSFVNSLEQLQWTTLLHNRLNFKYIPTEKLTVRLEFRNRLFYGDNVKNIFGFSKFISQDHGITDLSWNIIDNKDILFNTTIDRALINYAKGDWIVVMDCDLQDRPDEIPNLYKKALKGWDIVYARRFQRQDKLLKRISSRLFYWVYGSLSGVSTDKSIANFGIYHAKVIVEYNKMKELSRSFPSLVQYLGF